MSGSAVANDSRELFRVGEVSHNVRDVVDAAFFRGELDAPWQEFLRALACEKQAADEGREANDDAIDSAVQTFRYDHDLITAEETERWLADRGLTLSDFGEYFTRRFWGEAIDTRPADGINHYAAPAEMRELFVPELMLSGELGRMANASAGVWRLLRRRNRRRTPSS
jgi:hypothetical protein